MGNGKLYAIRLNAMKIGEKNFGKLLAKVFYRQHFLLYGMSTMWSTVLLTRTVNKCLASLKLLIQSERT